MSVWSARRTDDFAMIAKLAKFKGTIAVIAIALIAAGLGNACTSTPVDARGAQSWYPSPGWRALVDRVTIHYFDPQGIEIAIKEDINVLLDQGLPESATLGSGADYLFMYARAHHTAKRQEAWRLLNAYANNPNNPHADFIRDRIIPEIFADVPPYTFLPRSMLPAGTNVPEIDESLWPVMGVGKPPARGWPGAPLPPGTPTYDIQAIQQQYRQTVIPPAVEPMPDAGIPVPKAPLARQVTPNGDPGR